MKFIHTADIHLDSPLVGLAAYQNAPVASLRTATRDAFSALVDLAIDEAADFMVIAGDLYDGAWKDYNTGHYFVREMGRLNQAGVPVYLLHGNHDAECEMTKRLTLPPNVHLFDTKKPSSHRIEALRVALHGRSFREAATLDNLAIGYPDAVPAGSTSACCTPRWRVTPRTPATPRARWPSSQPRATTTGRWAMCMSLRCCNKTPG